MDDGQAVHVVDVQIERSGTLARVLWEPMDDRADERRLQKALERKKGILRAHVNSYVNQRVAVALEFVPRSAAPPRMTHTAELMAAVQADVEAAAARRREREGAAVGAIDVGVDVGGRVDERKRFAKSADRLRKRARSLR